MDFSTINHQIYAETPTTPLSVSEEREMVCRYHNGDMDARRRLIESNLRFVIKISLNFRNQGLSLADLIQEGNLGLIEALEKFDPSRNCRLITYASWWIRLYLQRALEQKTRQINLPINKTEILRKIRVFQDDFVKANGRRPSMIEISEKIGINAKKVEEIDNHSPSFHTLHASNDEHPGWESVLIDEEHENARDTVWNKEAVKRLSSAMKILNKREREVLMQRYNIGNNGKKLSLRKVGLILGLSAEGVRRIEEQAMSKLRRPTVRAKMEELFAA